MFGWSPTLKVANDEKYLLSLFLELLATGETSNLHKKFIDSETRVMDVGASSTFGEIGFDVGNPILIGLSDVRRDAMERASIDSVKSVILSEIKRIAAFADASEELAAFNERAANTILEHARGARKFLSSPPGFGFRHSGDQWRTHLLRLQESKDFRKDLTGKAESAFATNLLSSGKNFWREYITKWHLLDFDPYALASIANPSLLEKEQQEKQNRIDQFTNALKAQYAVATGDEALSLYKTSYDANSAAIEKEAKKVVIPDFVKNPPMTLDDQLTYRVEKLPGGNSLVTSTFETMTGATAGLMFNMEVVPDQYLLYVPALPALMTQVGVIKDGIPIPYDDAAEAMKREILWLNASYDVRYSREKVELAVSASGSDKVESEKALEWINLALFSPDWRKENLSRIRDAVDQQLSILRNTMQGREEDWVSGPANAFLRQSNPMILSAGSFLTQVYFLERLHWMLREAESPEEFEKFSREMSMVIRAMETMDRAGLTAYLDSLGSGLEQGGLLAEAIGDIRHNLGDVPDATLREDMVYLCNRIVADLKIPPETVLDDLNAMMNLIRRQSNVRAYLVANSNTESDIIPRIKETVARLSPEPSVRAQRQEVASVTSRLASREKGLTSPVYVGLVNPNTRNGVIVNNAPSVKYTDTDRESLLRFLASKLYGGRAAHGLFMKTWGAGLAYSNGVGSSELSGRISYYAERCPDLAQTLQFITNEINNAQRDTTLADYAIAQVFGSSRAASTYEERGQAMATDLADGITPEDIRRFREEIVRLRDNPDLYDQLHSRMKDVYAPVMPGLVPNTPVARSSVRFIIGPESQFESFENYLKASGEDAQVFRLYPRDFWITPTIAQ
jgi:Zn-dependent M16 (insulinase) family peptidase